MNRQLGPTKKGYTLLEVLLVMALMVAMLAIAIPTFRDALASQRLKQSANAVRAEWARGRVKAMKSGRAHVFRHTLGSNQYLTTAQFSVADYLETDDLDLGLNPDPMAFGIQDDVFSAHQFSELPKDVVFRGADVLVDQRTAVQLSSFEQQPPVPDFSMAGGAEEMVEIRWGMPVFFFPDGTTSSARLILSNDKQQAITIELRGLTGIARVGPVQPLGQLQPLETALQ